MATYSIITILSVCTGGIFTILYNYYGQNPLLLTILVLTPIAIGYYNTFLDENESTIKKLFMNMTNIILSFILTAITAMLTNSWI